MFVPYGDINPKTKTPYVNYTLIGINVFVYFFITAPLGPRGQLLHNYQYGFVPSDPQPYSYVTAMFLHADVMHLLGNMLYLWITGDNVEDSMGHVLFFFFFLASGVAAIIVHGQSVTGEAMNIPCIGASGAVSGVLGAYVVLFPNSRIKFFYWWFLFWGTVAIPALYAIGGWFLIQLLFAGQTGSEGAGVAYWAHIGGFIFGAGLAYVLSKMGICRIRRYRYYYYE